MEFKDFENALNRLEDIVVQLEKGDLPLEQALQLFEEGVRISRFCNSKLSEAERRVEILLREKNGELVEQPFNVTGVEEQA
jgi:exodeoxyribonuclease VII small subunit